MAPAYPSLITYPSTKAIRLHNVVCPYCGAVLSDTTRTKEHVIGRKFIPRGKLDAQWNLILNACSSCNNTKSDLEDDISAISMQPDAYGNFAVDDAALAADSRRKAGNSASRKTHKPVKDSNPELKFSVEPMRGLSMDFSFTGPAQVDDTRAFELARLQLLAFFFLITYKKVQERGWCWTGEYSPFLHTRKSDWGNASWKGFMATTKDWDMRLHALTADQFFCCIIKRHPQAECWSWAIQWNHQHRLAGFLGNRGVAQAIVNALPTDTLEHVQLGPNKYVRIKQDTALVPEDDNLFSFPGL